VWRSRKVWAFFGLRVAISNIQNKLEKKEMKLWLQNYAVVVLIEDSCIKFNNNNKIVYNSMALHKII
jgi:hypothetical protein